MGKEGDPRVRRVRHLSGALEMKSTWGAFHDSPSVLERAKRFIKPPKKETFPPEEW